MIYVVVIRLSITFYMFHIFTKQLLTCARILTIVIFPSNFSDSHLGIFVNYKLQLLNFVISPLNHYLTNMKLDINNIMHDRKSNNN